MTIIRRARGAWFRNAAVVLLYLCAGSPDASAGEDASVCVGKVPAAAERNAVGTPEGTAYAFDVAIDGRTPASASADQAVLIAGLSDVDRHLVVIRRGGKPKESFRFRFDQFGDDALCLWFNDFYETWSLWPMGDSKGKGCSCTATR